MLRFEWNALRAADKVLVHHPHTPDMTLTPGVVTSVHEHKGINRVGIRVGGDTGATAVLSPSRLTVHLDPRDPTEPCWRCQEPAPELTTPLEAPRMQAPSPARLAEAYRTFQAATGC